MDKDLLTAYFFLDQIQETDFSFNFDIFLLLIYCIKDVLNVLKLKDMVTLRLKEYSPKNENLLALYLLQT